MIVSARPAISRPSPLSSAPTLTGGARVEVCIAGAGLAGMIAGYLLAREKRAVMVLEGGSLGGSQLPAEMAQLRSEGGRADARSFAAAVEAIEAIVRRERIPCDFERLDGYCLSGCVDTEPAVRHPGQALLHPGKFAQGLARAIAHEGGRIHCGVRTRSVETGCAPAVLTSAGHRIHADVVVAPGAPRAAPADTSERAHVVALRVPRGAITRALYWDAAGERCARLRAQGLRASEVLLVSARADALRDEAAQYDALEAWARAHFPHAGELLQRFAEEVLPTAGSFAFAGRDIADSDSLYVGAAPSATPMTRAAIAGLLIKDLVDGSGAPARDVA